MGIEPRLQEQRGRNRIYLAAHLLLGETLLAQDTLRLARAQTLVDEFEGQTQRAGNALPHMFYAIGLGAFLTSQGARKATNENIGLMVLDKQAKRPCKGYDLLSGQHLERHGHGASAIGYGDTDTRFTYIETKSDHVSYPRII